MLNSNIICLFGQYCGKTKQVWSKTCLKEIVCVYSKSEEESRLQLKLQLQWEMVESTRSRIPSWRQDRVCKGCGSGYCICGQEQIRAEVRDYHDRGLGFLVGGISIRSRVGCWRTITACVTTKLTMWMSTVAGWWLEEWIRRLSTISATSCVAFYVISLYHTWTYRRMKILKMIPT